MRKFYFVGGPQPGYAEEFFRRLEAVGGLPAGWQLYPHAAGDGKALHIAAVESPQEISRHLEHFSDIYECSEIVEIVER